MDAALSGQLTQKASTRCFSTTPQGPPTGTGGPGEQQPAPADNTSAADRKKQFDTHHGISKLTSLHKKVGASGKLPKRLVEDVGATRNKATHRDYSPTIDETNLAIDTAVLVVEQAYPLTSF